MDCVHRRTRDRAVLWNHRRKTDDGLHTVALPREIAWHPNNWDVMEWFRQQIGDFHPLALADVPQLARFLRASKERSCEFSIANLYLWSFSYHVRWLVDDNRLYLHTENREEPEDALMVVVPEKVPDPPAKELLAFSEEMRKHGHTGRFQQLRENFVRNCPELSKWFEIQPMDEEVAEYVYRLDNLATLAGERYSKKRNLIKQFARDFPVATSRPLEDTDLPAVLAMSEEWLEGHPERASRHLPEEPSLHMLEVLQVLALHQFLDVGIHAGVDFH